jgi:hypothetical protein
MLVVQRRGAPAAGARLTDKDIYFQKNLNWIPKAA